MTFLSRKLLYAIEAVVDIAYNTTGNPVRSSEIGERQGIPPRYLEPVLQQLVRAGVLAGVRGPRGGYRLAKERRRISLGEIARIVRSLETTNDPLANATGSDLGDKVVRPLWRDLQTEWMKELDAVTVEDVCVKARRAGLHSEGARNLDFTI